MLTNYHLTKARAIGKGIQTVDISKEFRIWNGKTNTNNFPTSEMITVRIYLLMIIEDQI